MPVLVLAAAAIAGVLLLRRLAFAWADGKPLGLILLEDVGNGQQLAAPAAAAFRAMQAAARADDVDLVVNSGFRSHAEQEQLYAEYLAGTRTDVVARPGTSKHESGRAADIIVERSLSSPAGRWLVANASRFGFRNTVASEPWHWEYVNG